VFHCGLWVERGRIGYLQDIFQSSDYASLSLGFRHLAFSSATRSNCIRMVDFDRRHHGSGCHHLAFEI